MSDTYTTIGAPTEGDFRDRGSKFLAYAFRVFNEASVKECLEEVRKIHPKARHHCFSYRIGLTGDRFRANDDGEPSGTAGRPILGQIDSMGLSNVLVVVVRYFGGTKLGVPGLINAYKLATNDALSKAKLEERTIDHLLHLSFNYGEMNDVMQLVKKSSCEVLSKDFGAEPVIQIALRAGDVPEFNSKAEKISSLKVKQTGTR